MNPIPYHTLFLDRDGVINERLPGDYVAQWPDFQFTPRALEALAFLPPISNTSS